MRKLVLVVTVVSMFFGGTLPAQQPTKEQPSAAVASRMLKRHVVFDGDKVGENAKGWADPADKAAVTTQEDEVRTAGKKTVKFHGKGQGWMGCGWNWFGWFPADAGTDVSHYSSLRFWARLSGEKKPGMLTAALVANESDKDKKSSQACSLFKYCEGLADGKWHEIVIPIKDLYAGKDSNRTQVWELMLGCWAQDEADFNLFVDEIAFEGEGDPSSRPTASVQAPAPGKVVEPAAENAAVPLPKEINAADPNIRYVGRWDMTNRSAPRASWTYSLVTAKFRGTAINARLKGGGYYQVVVDGRPTRIIGPKDGKDLYELAKGLTEGDHVVEIVRRNEGNWIAAMTFMGFQLEKEGGLLPLPPRSERRILIIGDSISCGYGNEATRDEGNPLDKENGYMTYGGIAARRLGAELQIVAWSGRKLYPNNTMVELYDRALAMEDRPKADLAGWVPGVVLIDLGTNDFGNRNSLPDKKGWIDAYKAFIKTIRQTAPKAFIFVASGPMGTAAQWDSWAKTVVADVNQAGDSKVAYLPFPTQDINGDGIGGHWHPNLKTHAKMADRLTKEIRKAVGWDPLTVQAAKP